MRERTGGCLCGVVRYVVRGEPFHVGRCHCADCRKESGSTYSIYGQWPLEAFDLHGELAEYEGLAVEFSARRVSAVYTLWAPPGWRGPGGVTLGDEEGAVTAKVGAVVPIACTNYAALVHGGNVYYIVEGKLWGLGLMRRG